jgi:SH3-like domain-containing protein
MSDEEYEYLALLEHPNGMHLSGCCGVVTTYTVTGVEANDTRNVRTQPYAGADIVDKLTNGTSQLRKMDCRGAWCRITYKKEMEDWVNSRYIEEYQP